MHREQNKVGMRSGLLLETLIISQPTVIAVFVAGFQNQNLVSHEVGNVMRLCLGNYRDIDCECLKPFNDISDGAPQL